MKVLAFLSGIASLSFAACAEQETRAHLVDKMDAYYQSQFADLRLVKNGFFGESRVENSKIKGHTRDGGDPGYRSKVFWNTVAIYGNHGKPLSAKSIAWRYNRLPSGLLGETSSVAHPKVTPESTAKALLALKGKRQSLVASEGAFTYDARYVRLSKQECLPCHKGMKLNDPVAIIIYTTARNKVAK